MMFNSEGKKIPTEKIESFDDLLFVSACGWAVEIAKELVKDENIQSWEETASVAVGIVNNIIHETIDKMATFQIHIKRTSEDDYGDF